MGAVLGISVEINGKKLALRNCTVSESDRRRFRQFKQNTAPIWLFFFEDKRQHANKHYVMPKRAGYEMHLPPIFSLFFRMLTPKN
ncbi:hypothetical protein L596_001886 [Steinernema carpocapsae]|uniref:Uncharacterized protein n=1 Tax=Steinernema carpocapsae TaxID=34508 RepID=A0A4U8URF3_STECR|nr:hypothetical protein L596_001886 [Steinernema carpocapsae]